MNNPRIKFIKRYLDNGRLRLVKDVPIRIYPYENARYINSKIKMKKKRKEKMYQYMRMYKEKGKKIGERPQLNTNRIGKIPNYGYFN